METFFLAIAFILLGTIVAGMARVIVGPTTGDRMLAAQLFGTTGVAILLLLAQATGTPAVRNVALVFAVLAVIATLVMVQYQPPGAAGAAAAMADEERDR